MSSGVVAGSTEPTSLPAARKNEILDTASRLFASRGLRASLQEIAEACGIQPGSLYHHFESKEAIVVELIQRFHAELEQMADMALGELKSSEPVRGADRIVGLATAIAQCSVRNSAAAQFTFYDPPAAAGQAIAPSANRAPGGIEAAMLETLRVARLTGFIRSDVDLEMLADRICQTMLHAGLGLYHRHPADRVASVLCKILLHGVAVRSVKNAQLDRSPAMSAVERVLQQWNEGDDTVEDERAALIRAVARAEFGRKGYEVTTIRDIASAAGLSAGSIYRVIGSKEELLTSIMRSFAAKAVSGWSAAFGSDSTTVEKLDAGAWLQINVIDRFYDEFKIQLAWLRQVPPDIPKLGWSFSPLIRALKAELTDGVRSGEIRIDSPSAELTARCVVDLTWMPENIIRRAGKRTALAHARDTLLRGVAKRR